MITGGEPVRLGSLPVRKIRTAYELGLGVGKLAGDDLIPVLVDLFIVVDERDEITVACVDASVSCIGEALLGFFDVYDGPCCSGLNLADGLLGIVLAVVVDDDDVLRRGRRESGLSRGWRWLASAVGCGCRWVRLHQDSRRLAFLMLGHSFILANLSEGLPV